MDQHVWHVQIHGKAHGPCPLDEIQRLRTSGVVTDDSLVWTDGMEQWMPLRMSSLATAPQTGRPPPLPAAWTDPMGRAEPILAGGVPAPTLPIGEAGRESFPKLAVADDGWQDTSPSPWRRYFARMFDITIVGVALWFLLAMGLMLIAPDQQQQLFSGSLVNNPIISGVVTCLLVLPVLGVCLGLVGTTPGKWLLGVRVTDSEGRPIGVGPGVTREMEALFYGLGFGIPLIALFTAIASYSRLKGDGVTRWDQGKPWVVTHRPMGFAQVSLATLGVVTWFVVVMVLTAMNQGS